MFPQVEIALSIVLPLISAMTRGPAINARAMRSRRVLVDVFFQWLISMSSAAIAETDTYADADRVSISNTDTDADPVAQVDPNAVSVCNVVGMAISAPISISVGITVAVAPCVAIATAISGPVTVAVAVAVAVIITVSVAISVAICFALTCSKGWRDCGIDGGGKDLGEPGT
jgi:hypothetical protein